MAKEILSENFRKVWKFSIWFPDQKRKRRGNWLLSRYWGVMLEIYHYSLIIIVTFEFGRALLSFPLMFILIYFVLQNIFKKSHYFCNIAHCITLSHPDHHYDYHIGEYIGQLFNTTSSLSSLSWWHIRTPSFSDHFSNRCPFFQN